MKTLIADLKYKQQIFIQDGSDASLLKIFLSDGTSASVLYRLMRFLKRFKLFFPFAVIVQYINKLLNQCVIGLNADFGPGFVLMHPVGVVINSKVSGGNNIVVESGVVIGDEKGFSPKLESNIFIGAGAKIIGNVTVGTNTKIGANAVVVKDVASGDTVVGIPAKKLKKKVVEGQV